MNDGSAQEDRAARFFRARKGRRLGGVCAGLAPVGGMGVERLRAAFVLAALCGGVGIAAYLACWLIIPAGPGGDEMDGPSSAAVSGGAAAGVVGLALLGLLSALATVFGFGGAVLALAAVVLAASQLPRLRLKPALALLPVAALTLPAVAVALSPVRLALQSGASIAKPATAAAVSRGAYRSGLGTLLIDLRDTQLPASGTVPLRIDAGLRRTIVALPSDRCVRVSVRYTAHPFAAELGALVGGYGHLPSSGVVLFGRLLYPTGTVAAPARLAGPTLAIDFSSQGGGLVVRDYPDAVSPDLEPSWPGFPVRPEPRPYLKNEPRRLRGRLLRAWRQRRAVDLANERYVQRNLPGPCAPEGRP